MRVLGIDPGTAACGYGIVHESGGRLKAIDHGWWQTPARRRPELRLKTIFDGVTELIEEYEYQLKFVVARPEDMEEIGSLLDRVAADRSRVILMPEGIDAETLRQRGVWLAEICKREGFRFSPRLHVDLYGNTRGT